MGVLLKVYSLCCVCLQGGFSMFIQLMPIVVLILVSILSQMMVSPPPYSLYSRPYVLHTHTRTYCLSPHLFQICSFDYNM